MVNNEAKTSTKEGIHDGSKQDCSNSVQTLRRQLIGRMNWN